mgnify:CR=1 FL=1
MRKYVEQSREIEENSENEEEDNIQEFNYNKTKSESESKCVVGIAEQKHSELIERVMELQVLKRNELCYYDDSSDDGGGDGDDDTQYSSSRNSRNNNVKKMKSKSNSETITKVDTAPGSSPVPVDVVVPVAPVGRQRSQQIVRRGANVKKFNNTYR